MKWAAGCPVNILDELTYTVYEEFLGGLSGTYSIQDSILYLKRLDIKYFDWDYEHVGCVAPAPLNVPLNVVFKENNSDSIKATFFSDYLLFVCIDCYPENDSNANEMLGLPESGRYVIVELYIEKGKVTNYSIKRRSECTVVNGKYICNAIAYDDSSTIVEEIPKQEHLDKESQMNLLTTPNHEEMLERLRPYYEKQRQMEMEYWEKHPK